MKFIRVTVGDEDAAINLDNIAMVRESKDGTTVIYFNAASREAAAATASLAFARVNLEFTQVLNRIEEASR